MNVAILGFGTIGSGVYEILENFNSAFLKDITVTRILDLPKNKDKLPIITSDINDIINYDSIDLVVETLGGLHPAYEFIMAALQHKKNVVTANKAVVAAYLNEFINEAKKQQVHFLFEASTGGGIPWLAGLQKARRIDAIESFYGIFNGTSNFILDHMYVYDKDFEDALKLAQDLGYAEADPSADINGYDVQNKVVISSALAFDTYINMKEFPCYSMANITKNDIHYFKKQDKNIKYIGEAALLDGFYEAFVIPVIFPKATQEANVRSNFNLITLHGESIGDLKFFGQGAGKLPTANAIIQDILDIKAKRIEYDVNVDKAIPYSDTLFANCFMIRSNIRFESEIINHVETYENNYYMYTKAITTRDLKDLADAILKVDASALIAKIAAFE